MSEASSMERLAAALERLVTAISVPVIWLALATLLGATLMGVLQFSVVAIDAGIMDELATYAFVALIMVSLGLTYLRNGHVRIDFLADRFDARARAWIEVVGIVLALLPLSLLFVWDGGVNTWLSYRIGEASDEFGGLPWRWILKAFFPAGFALLLLAGAARLLRLGAFLANGRRE